MHDRLLQPLQGVCVCERQESCIYAQCSTYVLCISNNGRADHPADLTASGRSTEALVIGVDPLEYILGIPFLGHTPATHDVKRGLSGSHGKKTRDKIRAKYMHVCCPASLIQSPFL